MLICSITPECMEMLEMYNKVWSGREDLNLRLLAPEASALPGCATPRWFSNSKKRRAESQGELRSLDCGMQFENPLSIPRHPAT